MTRRSLIWLAILAVLMIAVHAVLASRLGTEADDVIVNYMWTAGCRLRGSIPIATSPPIRR